MFSYLSLSLTGSINTTNAGLLNAIARDNPGQILIALLSGADGTLVESRITQDQDALHVVAKKGNAESVQAVKILISQKVDLNSKNAYGWTALHEVCDRQVESPNTGITRVGLLSNESADSSYVRAIMYSLIEAGADPKITNKVDMLPMDLAKLSGRDVMFQEVLDAYNARIKSVKEPKQKRIFGLNLR